MSNPNHHVIAHQQDGAMAVLPPTGKPLTKKDAQRLASATLGSMLIPDKSYSLVIKTTVVEQVMQAVA